MRARPGWRNTVLVLRIAAIVFVVQALVTFALEYAPPPYRDAIQVMAPWRFAAVDAGMLTLVSSPLIYFWVLRPYVLRRKAAERQLRENDRRLRDAQRIAGIGSWELDLTTNALTWSDEIYRMFGIDPARFTPLYESFLAAIHPDDREAVNRAYVDSLATRTPYQADHRLQMPDGTIKWVRERCETDFDADGRPLVSRGTVQDITSSRAAEDELSESRAIVAGILEISDEAIVLADNNLRIFLFSRGAETVFGYQAAEAVGLHIEALIPPRFRASHDTHVRGFVDAPDSSLRMDARRELVGLRKDGSEFPAAVSLSKFGYRDGHLYSMIIRDIGPAKAVHEEIMAAKREAESASHAKSMFLANMSHELRTPLNAIIGFSEIISAQMFGPAANLKYVEYAGNINRSGLHLLGIINDILDISKIEAGRADLREDVVEVADVIDACVALLHGSADEHGVTIDVARRADLPGLVADELKLKQILINLLSNAVKFTPAGGRVDIRAWHDTAGLTIEIADTGIGMRAEDIPVALTPFRQLDGDLDRRFEGTGLGLPLAKALVEMHGGALELRSVPGSGTVAAVRFGPSRVDSRSPRALCGVA